MYAIAVKPGIKDSVHLKEVPKPSIDSISNNRAVLVKVLRVGLDATDKEIVAAQYGATPSGQDFLILGHESFGIVERVGSNVTEFKPGDYVVATVRRPGKSIYDKMGTYDMSTDDIYYERGINLLHGYLTEYYIDEPEYIVKVPDRLREVGVLLEPASVIEKGITQAYEIQRRLKLWQPKRAAVLGAGTIGLLATMALRNRCLNVCAFARSKPPYLNSTLVEEIDACYHSTKDMSLTEASNNHGPFDIIFEATGYSPLAFEAMKVLGKNGVLVLSGVTGGGREITIPSDKINLDFVLGNKVVVGTVNANREYFETGIKDFLQAEMTWPGWLDKLLTHPVKGLKNYNKIFQLLDDKNDSIKVFCEVASFNK